MGPAHLFPKWKSTVGAVGLLQVQGVTLQESKKCIVIGKVCWDMSITICHALDNSFFLMHYNWWGKSLQSVTHPEDKCVNALQEHYNLSYHGVTYDYNC